MSLPKNTQSDLIQEISSQEQELLSAGRWGRPGGGGGWGRPGWGGGWGRPGWGRPWGWRYRRPRWY